MNTTHPEGITWCDPPPPLPPPPDTWVARLTPFLEQIGQWGALPGDYSRNTFYDLRAKRYPIPQGQWEFEQRPVNPDRRRGRHRIWVRYLGPENGS